MQMMGNPGTHCMLVSPSTRLDKAFCMQKFAAKGFAMLTLDHHPSGRHFLQIPGPSPVPDRILRAMSLPTIDHRGPEFGALGRRCWPASSRSSRPSTRW
jgi:hypothetical protein